MIPIDTSVVSDGSVPAPMVQGTQLTQIGQAAQAVQGVELTQAMQVVQPTPGVVLPMQDEHAVQGSISTREPADFATTLTTLVCPQCNSLFGAQTLLHVPPMTPQSAVEADFHRLVQDVAFRGALVAVCPACEYAGWAQDFGVHMFPPDLVPAALEFESSAKFARAIKAGADLKSPALNLALLSLNGLWSARQELKPRDLIEPWMELTIKELSDALDDKSWRGNRPYYLYLRGEVRRQNGDFEGSLKDFDKTVPQMKVPRELIERQKALARSNNREPALLPPDLVEQIFCFRMQPLWVSSEAEDSDRGMKRGNSGTEGSEEELAVERYQSQRAGV